MFGLFKKFKDRAAIKQILLTYCVLNLSLRKTCPLPFLSSITDVNHPIDVSVLNKYHILFSKYDSIRSPISMCGLRRATNLGHLVVLGYLPNYTLPILVEKGLDINAYNKDGYDLMSYIAKVGRFDLFDELLPKITPNSNWYAVRLFLTSEYLNNPFSWDERWHEKDGSEEMDVAKKAISLLEKFSLYGWDVSSPNSVFAQELKGLLGLGEIYKKMYSFVENGGLQEVIPTTEKNLAVFKL
ncbi:MAG: hypothetical protein QG564_1338 [Campylobacterota bacterium]|nr:hypothetical protein [Campylobacterota bacterium]